MVSSSNDETTLFGGGGKEDGEEGAPPAAKRPRHCPPNVIVVVGGVEFPHYKDPLTRFSRYFDASIYWKLENEQPLRIELGLPWMTPEDWKEVSKFFDLEVFMSEALGGSSPLRITEDNVYKLMPWFRFLEMEQHSLKCEECLRSMTDPYWFSRVRYGFGVLSSEPLALGAFHPSTVASKQASVSKLITAFTYCQHHGLVDLKRELQDTLIKTISESPDFFTVASIKSLVSGLDEADSETKAAIWGAIKTYVEEDGKETLLECSGGDLDAFLKDRAQVIAVLIHLGMVNRVQAARIDSLTTVNREQAARIDSLTTANNGAQQREPAANGSTIAFGVAARPFRIAGAGVPRALP